MSSASKSKRGSPIRPLAARPGTRWQYVAIDTETELAKPGSIPRLVIATASDGAHGFFVAAQSVVAFQAAHAAKILLMHNARFDVPVLGRVGADFTGIVEAGRLWTPACFTGYSGWRTAARVTSLGRWIASARTCCRYHCPRTSALTTAGREDHVRPIS